MTTPDTPIEIRVVPVKGRDITVRRMGDVQFALMMRETKTLDRFVKSAEGPPTPEQRDRMITATARIFNLMESVVVGEEDRDYLLELVMANELTLSDLAGFMRAFEDAPTAGPTVRRGPGRPRKNAAR